MATAFSYSGTGLESAIQSGSGGIGTGSSITLEVDAIPADMEQGDTVKLALGSVSDWSAGNGETAYGDIGGAGANGGTNITLTDRGQEGTSAASWSEGDLVRVGVQGRDDAGPERVHVQSQGFYGIPGEHVYTDFSGSEVQEIAGTDTPSGHTWTKKTPSTSVLGFVNSGDVSRSQGLAFAPGLGDNSFRYREIKLPRSPVNNETAIIQRANHITVHNPSNSNNRGDVGFILWYIDGDNYGVVIIGPDSVKLYSAHQGGVTLLDSQNDATSIPNIVSGRFSEIESHVSFFKEKIEIAAGWSNEFGANPGINATINKANKTTLYNNIVSENISVGLIWRMETPRLSGYNAWAIENTKDLTQNV